jgi:hypothetical protein
MRRAAVAVTCAFALATPATVSADPGLSGSKAKTSLTAPLAAGPRLDGDRATTIFVHDPKVADWLERYKARARTTQATYSKQFRDWTVRIWDRRAGEVATGRVDDQSGAVLEAWTGPQVAWKMARGGPGAFGGKEINSTPLWLALCAIFFLGLADLRRAASLRNLDLLVLLSFSVSLWYFNRGEIFTSVPLAYPPLLYLLGRAAWSAWRGRVGGAASRPVWPVWVLAAATVFVAGFRVGLNVRDSNVIDVGYAGVIGAERIAHGQSPYGHFPVEDHRKACGAADREGEIRERIQANGRCESANEHGDTYGPVAYESYLIPYGVLGWSGKWDTLPAAHLAAILFDLLCVLGLVLVGFRFGGARLATTLAFAWTAYPFTQYVSSSNTNDALVPLFLIWGFWLVTSPAARGAFVSLASWTKFAPLVVLPLWASYPERRARSQLVFLAAFVAVTLAAFSILLLEPNPFHAARVFFDRTIRTQIDRESPFSLWDWRQYHAGLPDLHVLQRVLEGLLVVGAIAAYFFPRRKSPLQLAALTSALLIGFELVLTHWFYLYVPWFFPFAAFAVLAPRHESAAVEPALEPGREAASRRRPVPARS